MKKFLFSLFLFSALTSLAQPGDTIKKGRDRGKLIPDAATVKKMKKIHDSITKTITTTPVYNQTPDDISRNMDSILRLQKERRAADKKAAIIRIGIGLTFLAVLIIAWQRRRKKK